MPRIVFSNMCMYAYVYEDHSLSSHFERRFESGVYYSKQDTKRAIYLGIMTKVNDVDNTIRCLDVGGEPWRHQQ
jgi:hypothetical protein